MSDIPVYKPDTFRKVSFQGIANELKEKLTNIDGYTVVEGHYGKNEYPNAVQLSTPSGTVLNVDFNSEGTEAVVTHVFGQDDKEGLVPVGEDESVLFANSVHRKHFGGGVSSAVEMAPIERGISIK